MSGYAQFVGGALLAIVIGIALVLHLPPESAWKAVVLTGCVAAILTNLDR